MSPPAPQAHTPALDERSLLVELIGIAEQLTRVIEGETDCLDRSQWAEMRGLGPEKTRLALRYDALNRAVATLPRGLVFAHPELERLRGSVRRLETSAQTNARRLQLHLQANRRVAELVARAARNAVMPSVTYGARPGHGARKEKSTPPVSVTRLL